MSYIAPKVLKEKQTKYLIVVGILYAIGILVYMGTIQITGLVSSGPAEDITLIESPKAFSSFDACKKIEIRMNYEMDSEPVSRDRYFYEPLVEVLGIIIMCVGFISLRMVNKAGVSTIIIPAYSCYGIWIATFLLALYDSSAVGKFAQDIREIYVGLAVSNKILRYFTFCIYNQLNLRF